jgi:hypothetical protein
MNHEDRRAISAFPVMDTPAVDCQIVTGDFHSGKVVRTNFARQGPSGWSKLKQVLEIS